MEKGHTKTGEKPVQRTSKREARPTGKVLVRNRANFCVDVRVGREYLHFEPYEEKELSKTLVEHEDFAHQRIRFGVREK